MSLLSVIFKKPTRAEIGVLTLDASINETHQRNSIVTSNAIEDGTTIQDHIKLEPITLQIEGLVSSNPVNFVQTISGTITSTAAGVVQDLIPKSTVGGLVSQATSQVLGSVAGLITDTPRDPRTAFQYLEQLWSFRIPFTVITALRRYENMAIETLSVPRNATTGRSLRFQLGLKEIRKVQSVIVRVPAFKVGVKSATSNVEKGKQASDEAAKNATTEKSSSILNQWIYGGK